jgi:protein involved in polysaccharide export with SLBB domain
MRSKFFATIHHAHVLCAATLITVWLAAGLGFAQVGSALPGSGGPGGSAVGGYAGPGGLAAPASAGSVTAPVAPTGTAPALGIGPSTGVAMAPNGVSVSSLSGAVGRLSPQQVNEAMRALGISPNEALVLQQQLATGVISPQEVQSLCAHLAASNINPALVQSVAGTIGLNAAQLQQVQGCLPGMAGGQPPLTAPGISGQLPPLGVSAQQQSPLGAPLMQSPLGAAQQSVSPAAQPQFAMPGAGFALPGSGTSSTQMGPAGSMTAPSVTVSTPSGTFQTMPGGVTSPMTASISPQMQPVSPSLIEQSYGQLDLQLPPANPSPTNLNQFGYSIFASAVSSLAPLANTPVGPDYVIGPGDQLNIYMWGRLNQTVLVMVDRDGSVEVSGIEPLQIGGLTFDQAKKLIEGRVSQISNVNVHVTMGPLRTIQVMVVGAVNQPGSYTISPLSRVSAALIAAGGPAKIGTLRGVELRRGNRVVKRVDFYKLLLSGDNNDDVYLQTNDVVFVPPVGPVVGVVGDVQRPAIYELHRAGMEVSGALRLAAGASPFSNTERVQVERVDQRRRLIVLDVPYAELSGRHFELRDGDLVKVFHMLTMHREVVVLTGNVRRPGEFQWRPNMKVSDLVALGGGTAEHTYFKYALLRRVMYPSLRQRFIQIDLQNALMGDPRNPADQFLQPLDEVDIFNEDALRQAPTANVTGEVQLPGSYALNPGMKLSDLLYMAGGLKDDADFSQIQIDRTEIVDGSKTHFVRLYGNLHKSPGHPVNDPQLTKNDQIYVTVASGYHPPWTVTISGEVTRPGTYPIHRDERLSSVLVSCGGFTTGAFPKGIVFTRQSVQQIEQERLNQSVQQLTQGLVQFSMFTQVTSQSPGGAQNNGAMMANLQSLLTQAQTQQATGRVVVHVDNLEGLEASPDDVVLQNGDTIAIPMVPASVSVLGSVNEPSSITAQPGWTVRDYLYRAGGPTPYADTDLIMVVKADGSVITQGGLKAAHSFPFSSVITGGLMGLHLQAGDTIYVPSDVQTFIKTQYAMSVSTIFANAAQAVAVIALLATKL